MGALALLCAATLAAGNAEAPEWTVGLRPVDSASPGKQARLVVELTARAGFHVNEDYPLSFRPAKSEGAEPLKPRFDRADGLALERCKEQPAHACGARLPVVFVVSRAERVEVKGTFAFSVCDPNRCLIQKVELSATLAAK